VEDTNVTIQDIKEQFGAEIARLVDGVTKISRIHMVECYNQQSQQSNKVLETREENTRRMQAQNMRKLIVAMAVDIRVIDKTR